MTRGFYPQPKPASRVQMRAQRTREDRAGLDRWRLDVFTRDRFRCRKCGCRVQMTVAAIPTRAEAHHLARRAIRDVRHDVRNGLTLCRICHELVTGKVAERWRAIGTRFFVTSLQSPKYIDATYLVRFERVA